MRTSTAGVRKIKKWEKLVLVAYQDVGGVWTIGYGHTGSDVHEGQVCTESEAEEWLRGDLQEAEDCINAKVKVRLEQHQFDALVSFVFNVGCSAFAKSTLLRVLNQKQYDKVPAQLERWNKDRVNGKLVVVAGLVNRRAAEIALWHGASVAEGSNVRPVPAEPKKLTQSKTMQGAAFTGVGVVGEEISRTVQEITPYAEAMEWLRLVCVLLTVVGLGLVVYGRLRVRRDENV